MNKLQLAGLAVICWISSIILAFYGTFRMAALVRETNSIMEFVGQNNLLFPNGTLIVNRLDTLKSNIFTSSRVEGIGTDVIFSIIMFFMLGNSLKYFSDWSVRAANINEHRVFWFGIILDVLGIILSAEGFNEYGGKNPQNGTAFISSGMTCIAAGSFFIIRRYETDTISNRETLHYNPSPPGYHGESI